MKKYEAALKKTVLLKSTQRVFFKGLFFVFLCFYPLLSLSAETDGTALKELFIQDLNLYLRDQQQKEEYQYIFNSIEQSFLLKSRMASEEEEKALIQERKKLDKLVIDLIPLQGEVFKKMQRLNAYKKSLYFENEEYERSLDDLLQQLELFVGQWRRLREVCKNSLLKVSIPQLKELSWIWQNENPIYNDIKGILEKTEKK